jgi:type IV pilus assembly protein PilQ
MKPKIQVTLQRFVIASERSERSNLKPLSLRPQAGEVTEDEMSEGVPRAPRAANLKAIIFTLFLALVFIFSNSMIVYSDTVTAQPGEEVTQPGNVTLIFRDADIRTVLHALSYKSGVNIVASSDVEGAVSIRLIDVPWETALEVILKNHGLAAERVGNIIRVITLANVAEEELQNEVFILNYAKSKEIADAIEATVTNRGRIKYDERTNTLIVTDIPTNLYKVRTVVSRLDRRTPQVAIEARIIEARLNKNDELGIDWNMVVSASGSARPTTFPFEGDRVPFAKPKSGGSIKDYLPGVFPDPTGFAFGTLDFTQLTAALKLLNEKTDTNVISNPTVTTLNNKEAKIIVGQIFNIPTYERNDTTGKMEVTGYTEKDIGIILTVTPNINDTGDIIVDLKPEVSGVLADWDNFGTTSEPMLVPRFTTRAAQTQVMIKDGQTIVIGGLRENQTEKIVNKVPFLGDIPLVGELFKYKADNVVTKDLLIFVTVRLVPEERDDRPIMDQTIRDFFDVKEPEDMVYR